MNTMIVCCGNVLRASPITSQNLSICPLAISKQMNFSFGTALVMLSSFTISPSRTPDVIATFCKHCTKLYTKMLKRYFLEKIFSCSSTTLDNHLFWKPINWYQHCETSSCKVITDNALLWLHDKDDIIIILVQHATGGKPPQQSISQSIIKF